MFINQLSGTLQNHIEGAFEIAVIDFVITEFLPTVPWSGKHNTISCPAGHHYYEGRWLHDPQFLDDYCHDRIQTRYTQRDKVAMTSSPLPILAARNAISRAAVPLQQSRKADD